MASLTETFEMIKQAEYEAKLETLQEAWANDEARCEMLNEALDLIKEAQEEGSLPEMDAAQILDCGVAMVEEAIAEQAGAEQSEEVEEETEKLAEEELADLGFLAGQVLAANDITAEDLEKLGEEEAEELGRMVAHDVAKILAEQAEQAE